MKQISLLCVFVSLVLGKQGYGPTDQEWGFVTVRENAHMFWWLHYTTADVSDVYDRPLIIWLQGGPGASSTGFGNFFEVGPIDIYGNERNTSWVKDANLLFVDNPVGAGFSYLDDLHSFAKNNTQIANDFVEVFKSFSEQLPGFKKVPVYIFSESYGGKMTVDIALALNKATKEGKIECHLKAVGLGDSWISPIDSVLTWAPFLKNLDMLDNFGYDVIHKMAKLAEEAIEKGKYGVATDLWGMIEGMVGEFAMVDFYNVLTKIENITPLPNKYRGHPRKRITDEDVDLDTLMNGPVKEALSITQDWGVQADMVFSALNDDFMVPVTQNVENILNNTDIVVAVYNGQLDLIVDTQGTIEWLNNLNWDHSSEWSQINYEPFEVNGWFEGYKREIGNLKYFSIMRSGHMVPIDNPAGMSYVLSYVTNNFTVQDD